MESNDYKLNLRNDYVFKVMHYYDEEVGKEIFASLVGAITGETITYVEFMPTDLYSYEPEGKDVRYDLCAKVNTVHAVDLEMQIYHMSAVPDRVNFYSSMLYVNQNNKGVSYDQFIDAKSIFLCEQNVFPDRKEYIHRYCMKDEHNRILTEKMQAHIIELRKGLKMLKDVRDLSLLEKWILFLMCYEEKSENPMIQKLVESEDIFRKAVEVLKVISEDQRIREQAFARSRFEKDMAQIHRDAEKIRKEGEKIRKEGEKLAADAKKMSVEAEMKISAAEKMTSEAVKKIADAETKIADAETKIADAENKMIETDKLKAELEHQKQNLINEAKIAEKTELIQKMLEDGFDSETIMKYARCSRELIQEVTNKM